MKKLKLKLDSKEMLTREQMKKVNGGYGNCYAYCCSGGPGTCGEGTFIHLGCTTNEACQTDAQAVFKICPPGYYVAGLCHN